MEAQVRAGSTAVPFMLAASPLALLPTTVVSYGRQAASPCPFLCTVSAVNSFVVN